MVRIAGSVPAFGAESDSRLGTNTPPEIVNRRASSIEMGNSLASFRGTVIVYPVKGVGELGMKMVMASPDSGLIDFMVSPVTSPMDQMPFRGY